ncbi:hypothetical protein Y032_0035g3010 [Ancylostoma ceylanicum]|uniref:GOLD domain-containing protein n=1 Tax=Ancylostoma ceylanicum TaxID=53326 RepID=A0A016ULT0_9BILA|nr:hypothetical protein Y032_0035g3010 [Ancylostoma ceylanicum]
MRNLLLFLLLVLYSYALTMKTSAGVEAYIGRTITMDLDSRMTCFYEPLEKNMSLKLSVNVRASFTRSPRTWSSEVSEHARYKLWCFYAFVISLSRVLQLGGRRGIRKYAAQHN